jgi:hypothetical protein
VNSKCIINFSGPSFPANNRGASFDGKLVGSVGSGR